MNLFVVEDDPIIAKSIQTFHEPYGYSVFLAQDFSRVIEEFTSIQPHVVILDINLPYQNGFYLCQQIRIISSVPILFLSARQSEMEQVFGMESGADDYITKPFHLEVLLAKIKAILRRAYGEYTVENPTTELHLYGLTLHIKKMAMSYQGETQTLTKNEWKLLYLLMSRAETVVSREEYLEKIWDDIRFVDDNTLTVNINRIRKKLYHWGLDSLIETQRGIGYIFHEKRRDHS